MIDLELAGREMKDRVMERVDDDCMPDIIFGIGAISEHTQDVECILWNAICDKLDVLYDQFRRQIE